MAPTPTASYDDAAKPYAKIAKNCGRPDVVAVTAGIRRRRVPVDASKTLLPSLVLVDAGLAAAR